MKHIKFNTRIRKVGNHFEIIIPSYLILKYELHEGEILNLTVNGKDMIVEKNNENRNSTDKEYPKIVFSAS